ncbi:MAG: hypothetical protein F4W90_04230 [Gammaproteobacteria bacterium]|nr:hypothetical protein [Gammaproteobacteria bacterium]
MHTLLLRGSGDFELHAVMDNQLESGVECGELLSRLVDAIIGGSWDAVEQLRGEALHSMGTQQAVDAMAVAAAFNGITRIADATGIPLDAGPAETTATMRDELRIDDFEYAEKTRKFDRVTA